MQTNVALATMPAQNDSGTHSSFAVAMLCFKLCNSYALRLHSGAVLTRKLTFENVPLLSKTTKNPDSRTDPLCQSIKTSICLSLSHGKKLSKSTKAIRLIFHWVHSSTRVFLKFNFLQFGSRLWNLNYVIQNSNHSNENNAVVGNDLLIIHYLKFLNLQFIWNNLNLHLIGVLNY